MKKEQYLPDESGVARLVVGMNAILTKHQAANSEVDLYLRYSEPMFRGTPKPREGDQRFKRLVLDIQTALNLGSNNVGLFVENCPSFERMVEHFQNLNGFSAATWVIVASSEKVKDDLLRISETTGGCAFVDQVKASIEGAVVVATPEELPSLSLIHI